MKAEFEGFDGFTKQLQDLSSDSVIKDVTGKMLYEGAAVIADRIRANIKALPISSGYGSQKHKLDGVTQAQKSGLLSGFGISKVKKKGDVYDLHIGFDGYNSQRTKKFPQGQPNILIARSVEGGTSFRRPHPFVQPAIRSSLTEAYNRMNKAFDEAIQEKTK